MTEATALTCLLYGHWVADFCLQDRYTAKNKSHKFDCLAKHCAEIFAVLVVFGAAVMPEKNIWLFSFFNTLSHGLIDKYVWTYYKSRIPSKDFPYWEDGNFYSTIGFDQFLHITILVWSYFIF